MQILALWSGRAYNTQRGKAAPVCLRSVFIWNKILKIVQKYNITFIVVKHIPKLKFHMGSYHEISFNLTFVIYYSASGIDQKKNNFLR